MEPAAPEAPAPDAAAETAADEAPAPRYGYTEENPILVGGGELEDGPARERAYLGTLLGPDGQDVRYRRIGSCCPFEMPNAELFGMLDLYEVRYDGLDEPVTLYLDMYDPGETHAPEGFVAGEL